MSGEPTNEDAKIIVGNFCDVCCQNKLNYIVKYELTNDEMRDLKKYSNIKFAKM